MKSASTAQIETWTINCRKLADEQLSQIAAALSEIDIAADRHVAAIHFKNTGRLVDALRINLKIFEHYNAELQRRYNENIK